jgi:hypothetical protein
MISKTATIDHFGTPPNNSRNYSTSLWLELRLLYLRMAQRHPVSEQCHPAHLMAGSDGGQQKAIAESKSDRPCCRSCRQQSSVIKRQ